MEKRIDSFCYDFISSLGDRYKKLIVILELKIGQFNCQIKDAFRV